MISRKNTWLDVSVRNPVVKRCIVSAFKQKSNVVSIVNVKDVKTVGNYLHENRSPTSIVMCNNKIKQTSGECL